MALLFKVSNTMLLTTNISVIPNTGVARNYVEALWQQAKAKFKSMFGPTNPDMIPDYLAEFM